jgi:hypothetical protein
MLEQRVSPASVHVEDGEELNSKSPDDVGRLGLKTHSNEPFCGLQFLAKRGNEDLFMHMLSFLHLEEASA